MDSLIDECPSALAGPTSFNRPAVVFGGSIPLYIRVSLQNISQPPIGYSLLQEHHRIVEAMLADDSQLNTGFASENDHPLSSLQIDRDRLLYKHMLFAYGAEFNNRQPVTRRCTDVDVVHPWMTTELLNRRDKLRTGRVRKLLSGDSCGIRARSDLIPNIPVGLCMFGGDRSCPDYSNSHPLPPLVK